MLTILTRPARTTHPPCGATAPANADVLAVHRVLSEVRVDCLCPESAVPATAASIRRATEEANGDEVLTSSSSSPGPCIRPAVDDLMCVQTIAPCFAGLAFWSLSTSKQLCCNVEDERRCESPSARNSFNSHATLCSLA